ncbi:class II aldolase/adducin family protein, partial [Streptococcus pneumoniae]
MVDLGRSFFERGYTVGGAGNLSVRLDDNHILV